MAKAKPKRRAVPKKMRFEVFKRDSFTCQYCGESAPDVTLHLDHIVPVIEGGKNSLLNLVTSCQGCNLGKGPRALSDRAAIKTAKSQADELQQRHEQIEMMAKWQLGLVDILEKEVDTASDFLMRDTTRSLTDVGKKIMRKAIRKFGLMSCMEAISIARDQYFQRGDDGAIDGDSISNALEKVGGICWNRAVRDKL